MNVGTDESLPAAEPDRLAHARLETALAWTDLVLPPKAQETVDGIRTAGLGAAGFGARGDEGQTALFRGPSGSGKSLAAALLGKALGRAVFAVDLSAIVSKYIGETEKHIDRAFDAAEAAGAILLFDEADALFGKRTKVEDAHDRYADREAAHLLRRLDRFRGLVLFATRHKENIDPAFVRRLRFVVDFPPQ